MTSQLHTFAELQQEMHDALRAQHPEWIQPDGESPICDFYDARLAELLVFARRDQAANPQNVHSNWQ